MNKQLIITSKSFDNNGNIPKRNTGFGEDISPDFTIVNLPEETVSIAIVMFDLEIPIIGKVPHWIIWNIPPMSFIPENIPYGAEVASLDNARQGVAYGKNRYRGPKQPFFINKMHRYEFSFFALDKMLDLSSQATAEKLFSAMDGHIITQGKILGKYKK